MSWIRTGVVRDPDGQFGPCVGVGNVQNVASIVDLCDHIASGVGDQQ